LKEEDGTISGVIEYVKDITKQKQMERALQKSMERVDFGMEVANDGLWDWNLLTNFVFFDARYYTLAGYEVNEFPHHLDEFKRRVHKDDIEQVMTAADLYIKGKIDKFDVEFRFAHKDGNWIWIRGRGKIFERDKNGNPLRFIGTHSNISERKKAEEELTKSEQRFRDISNSMADWIWEVDKDGKYTFVSRKVKKVLGYESTEFFGKTPFDFMSEDEAKRVGEIFKEIASAKKPIVDLENWNITKEGKIICLLTNGIPIIDESGKLIGYRGVDKDITDRKNTEKELKRAKNHFKALFNSMTDPVVIIDSKGKFLEMSEMVKAVTGFEKDELLGKNFLNTKLLTRKSRAICLKNLIKRMSGIEVAPYEVEVCVKDGDKLPFEINANKIKFKGKNADMVVFRDISDRKKAEAEIQKLASVVKHSSELVNLATLDGKMIFLNEAGRNILGINPDEVHKHHISDVIPENLQLKLKNEVIPSILKKGKWGGELQYKNLKTGKITDVQAHTFIIKDKFSNKPLYFSNISLDITDKKKADEKLKDAYDLLQKMNKELEVKVKDRTAEIEKLLKQKDEFINQLGHDLKNPLNPLVNLLPILEKEETNPKNKEILNIVIRNVDYMKNLVMKTIDLAKLNSNKTKFSFEEIDLYKELEKNIIKNAFLFKKNNIRIINKFRENIKVKVDKLRIEELFDNLFNNSVKYSGDSGKIILDAVEDDHFITIFIKDNGIGMNEEQINHIFDEFYKADESRHDFDSSGLGMPICKRIVEKHGGKIWVESEGINKGTTVCFTLPLV